MIKVKAVHEAEYDIWYPWCIALLLYLFVRYTITGVITLLPCLVAVYQQTHYSRQVMTSTYMPIVIAVPFYNPGLQHNWSP